MILAPVSVDNEVSAYLVTLEPKEALGDNDFLLLGTEHAATICGLILGRELVVAKAAGRARNDLIEGLLLGRTADREEVARWASHLGYESSLTHRVVVLRCAVEPAPTGGAGSDERRTRVQHVMETYCRSRSPVAVTAVRGSEVVVLAPDRDGEDGPSPKQLAEECTAYCAELFSGAAVTIGISRPCAHAIEIARAYAEASRTVDAATRLGWHGRPVLFEDLGVHRLLLRLPDLGEVRAFAIDAVGDLIEYDARHGSHLMETLAAYFRYGASTQRMARHLHVHVNTVSYRLRRITEVADLDLDCYSDRLAAQVALEILDALGPPDV